MTDSTDGSKFICFIMCVLVLTTHGGGPPVHRDAILTAFVCICCNTSTQTFTVTPTVAVAGVR